MKIRFLPAFVLALVLPLAAISSLASADDGTPSEGTDCGTSGLTKMNAGGTGIFACLGGTWSNFMTWRSPHGVPSLIYTDNYVGIGTSNLNVEKLTVVASYPRIASFLGADANLPGGGGDPYDKEIRVGRSESDYDAAAFGYNDRDKYAYLSIYGMGGNRLRFDQYGHVAIGGATLDTEVLLVQSPYPRIASFLASDNFLPGGGGDPNDKEIRVGRSESDFDAAAFGYNDVGQYAYMTVYGMGGNRLEFDTHGNASVQGNFNSLSDARLKTDILSIDHALDKVARLQGVTYSWRVKEFPERKFSAGEQVGLIAQDVEKVVPEVVSEGADGYKSIAYDKLVPLLVEAIKELKTDNNRLRQEFESYKTKQSPE